MACEDYTEKILKEAWDELSKSERIGLQNHLTTCSSCRELLALTRLSAGFSEKIARQIPRDDKKEGVIQQILIRTSVDPKHPGKSGIHYASKYSKVLQIAVNAAAVLLIVCFCYQQISINRDLKRLETRIREQERVQRYQIYREHTGTSAGISAIRLGKLVNAWKVSAKDKQETLEYLQENYPRIYQSVIEMYREKNR